MARRFRQSSTPKENLRIFFVIHTVEVTGSITDSPYSCGSYFYI
jgi:hypothetical protein